MRKMVESINPVTIRDCLLVEFPTDQPKRICGLTIARLGLMGTSYCIPFVWEGDEKNPKPLMILHVHEDDFKMAVNSAFLEREQTIKGRVATGSLTVRTEKILDFIKFLIFGFSGQNASTGVPAEFEVIVESKKFMTAMKHLFATDPVWVQFLSGFQFGSGKTGGV